MFVFHQIIEYITYAVKEEPKKVTFLSYRESGENQRIYFGEITGSFPDRTERGIRHVGNKDRSLLS